MILSVLENGRILTSVIQEPSFDLFCDVLCVGAGSAGVYAADSAAREGADVILCEIGENIGGMHVCGNVTGYYYGARGGSYEEDDVKTKKDRVFLQNGRHWEQRQIRLTQRLAESGVRVFCRYSAIGLFLDEGRVKGIRAFDGKKIVNIRAEITIDATSDGHLIRMLNVNKQYGRHSNGGFVPFTVRVQYLQNGKLGSCNSDSGIMDHYKAKEFSQGTILAHANASRLLEKFEFVNVALQTGVREGLSFEGEAHLSYEDLLLGKHPQRVLFWAYSDLDRHGSERATEEELFQNWWVISNLATVTVSIPVPMGSVVPKGIRGLVTAGRCLSCDTYSQSAVRMNRDMFRMGECVGIAAAMAVRDQVDFLEIDYEEFLARARERGCFEGYSQRAFSFDNTYALYLQKMKSLGIDPDPKYQGLSPWNSICEPIEFDMEKNFHLLKTASPGVAIWSCYLARDREQVGEKLFQAMTGTDDTVYRYNCAIALGLMGDARATDVLREIFENRDCFFFQDNRRSNQFRSAVAVCLLGRLGTLEDLERLFEILSEKERERPMYHTLKPNYLYSQSVTRNFVYFSMVTHACMAICKIGKRCGYPMERLHERFKMIFGDQKLLRRLTVAAPGTADFEEIDGFLNYILRITDGERS
ncbi:MAG: FAD-dependent oxidoreductase [Clostridia bacterium]|nr:FAD-dependent oxidoreductase [Clostridia bacterium]